MKKVWILEKFATREEMIKTHNDMKAIADVVKTPEELAAWEMAVAGHEKMIAENPDGRWFGFEGKTLYRQFCDVARAAIRRNPEGKFRVVEGEIEDDAKYWNGYKVTKVNDGVLRYLMATK